MLALQFNKLFKLEFCGLKRDQRNDMLRFCLLSLEGAKSLLFLRKTLWKGAPVQASDAQQKHQKGDFHPVPD